MQNVIETEGGEFKLTAHKLINYVPMSLHRVARFFLVHDTKTAKMYQMNTKCTKLS
jgi:hypothetical protein